MTSKLHLLASAAIYLLTFYMRAEDLQCKSTGKISGVVSDPAGAVISGARILINEHLTTTSDIQGRFSLPCVKPGGVTLHTTSPGFADAESKVKVKGDATTYTKVSLSIRTVETIVEVGQDSTSLDSQHGIGTGVITGSRLSALAGDPDDLKRQLQVLAGASGGAPGTVQITVDGFQNSSAIPPKASIDRIVTAPDTYSAEFQQAPYGGGRVDIYTKAGATAYHGALFYTDSEGSFNATDAFSVTPTPAGKRRYGGELTGPILKKRLDFSLSLEKRDITEFNVVNAITITDEGAPQPVRDTVDASQNLWNALTRFDFQATPANSATLSFTSLANALTNQGVGGLTLADAGYADHTTERTLRLTDTHSFGSQLLNEGHVGFTWKDDRQSPSSTSPNVVVEGFFNAGGSVAGPLNTRERDLEIDDDLVLSRGRNTWKFGEQALGIFFHKEDPESFNGSFIFGGGTAPILTESGLPTLDDSLITSLEQYRRARLNLPGGTPTSFRGSDGSPLIALGQWRLGLYIEDLLKLLPTLTLSTGLRYSLQSSPSTNANVAPRLGLAWAFGKNAASVLSIHSGIFYDPIDSALPLEASRLNGVRQRETLVYSPSFQTPRVPTSESVSILTLRKPLGHFTQVPSNEAMVAFEHDLPHHWHPQVSTIYVNTWGLNRSRNANAPLVDSTMDGSLAPIAVAQLPRPFGTMQNLYAYEQSGHLNGLINTVSLDQHAYNRLGFTVGYVHMDLHSDTTQNAGFTQSAYSNAGERSAPDFQRTHQIFAFGNLQLPLKIALSTDFDASSGAPYNAITGTDNNGDGQFNDRPSKTTSQTNGAVRTPFGFLDSNVINGNLSRNVGEMPWVMHLDTDVSREWKLGKSSGSGAKSLILNFRTANVLNHVNVTAVGTVVSSPTFAQSLAAEASRRIEVGVRATF